MIDLPLRIADVDAGGSARVGRAELLAAHGTRSAVWEASGIESRDFLPAFDFIASHGLEREPIAERLRAHTYTTAPLRFRSLHDCYVMPAWGVVFDADGVVDREASMFAAWLSPDLSALPRVVRRNDATYVTADALDRARDLLGTHLLLHHAGHITYGHWLTDCILGAWVLADEIRRGELRLLAAPLQHWQRQTLEAFGIRREAITETSRSIVRCEHLIVPSCLDLTNLLNPTALLGECFRALRRQCPAPRLPLPAVRRIYIARGAAERRTMRNEGALIASLEERGFVAVYPRGLSIAQQAALFGGAECTVGAMGSALANLVYMDAGSQVVEISPIVSKSSFWTARLAAVLGLRYAATIVDVAPEDCDETMICGRPHLNLDYRYDADIPAVLRALDVFGVR